jgi:hypothetical protein
MHKLNSTLLNTLDIARGPHIYCRLRKGVNKYSSAQEQKNGPLFPALGALTSLSASNAGSSPVKSTRFGQECFRGMRNGVAWFPISSKLEKLTRQCFITSRGGPE